MASRNAAVVDAPVRSRARRRPAEPAARPKLGRAAAPPRTRVQQRRRSRAGIAAILLGGLLLAGVVFVNLAVLRLNLRLDRATQERSKLKAENAALYGQLSAALASGKIQALAHRRDGLVEAGSIGYIDLGKR